MRLFVVSDLHIRGPLDPIYSSLLKLLSDELVAGDVIVFAGDVFDIFVGNKKIFRRRYSLFLEELYRLGARGVTAHYIEGNHDFLLGRALGRIPGVRVHPHEVRLELGGRKFFIAHGDTADATDYGYRVMRFLFRSPLMKGVVAAVPGGWLDRVGRGSSRISRGAAPIVMSQLPTQRAELLRNRYRSYAVERLSEGFDFVVLGHCHDLDEMKFRLGDRQGHYMNVGFPPVHRTYVFWQAGDLDLCRRSFF